jgi:hypothetical protein
MKLSTTNPRAKAAAATGEGEEKREEFIDALAVVYSLA